MKRNLTGYQFGIYWTIHVSKALASSNGNDCITLSIKNIDYKKMGKLNGLCHFVKKSLILLFYRYHTIKHVLNEVKHIFNILFEKNIDD